MPNDVFFFDPPGPCNYRAPWLTFFPGDLLCAIPEQRRTAQATQHKIDSSECPDNRIVEPPRKRQRTCNHNPPVISLLSSDEERTPRAKCHRKQIYRKRVSVEDIIEGMAAAKRLSRNAVIQPPREEKAREPLQEIPARQLPGIRRFGAHTNSYEIKNSKFLVEMGVISPRRATLSDPTTLESLTHDPADWITPQPTFSRSPNPSSSPPSSFIPLDMY